jgi:hypothetical protein
MPDLQENVRQDMLSGEGVEPTMSERTASSCGGSAQRALILSLATLFVMGIWLFHDMHALNAVLSGGKSVEVRVGRAEFIFVLILLLLNVMMTLALLRSLKAAGRLVRHYFTVSIASLLALVLWISAHFLSRELEPASEVFSGRLNGMEVILAGFLVLASALGALLLLRRLHRARPILTMSAYSKQVRVNGRWVPIEEYLRDELGIEISHGMTEEEKEGELESFRRQCENEGIPRPRE